MKELQTIIKMMMDSGAGWSASGDSKRKKRQNRVAAIFLIFVALPFAITIGLVSYCLAEMLTPYNLSKLVLYIWLGIACMFMFFFGIFMSSSVFYFSEDVVPLFIMPVKETSILNAKFFVTYIWENLTSVFIFLPAMVGYAFSVDVGLLFWINGLFVLATMSIIPMIYGIVISMLAIRFTSFGKDETAIAYVSGVLSVVASVVISVFLIGELIAGNDLFIILLSASNGLVNFLTTLFPFIKSGISLMIEPSLISLLMYVGLHLLFLLVYFVIAKTCYYEGILRLTSGNKRRFKVSDKWIDDHCEEKGALYAFVKKDLVNLFFNPSFFSACIVPSVIMPAILFLMRNTPALAAIQRKLSFIVDGVMLDKIMIMAIVCMALFASGMNYIASTAISREGADFKMMKSIPIAYETQVYAKGLSAFITSFISFWLSTLALNHIMNFTFLGLVGGFISGLLLVILTIEIGLIADLKNPTITWTDEQKAVKQNFNGMICLIMSVLTGIAYYFVLFKIDIDFLSLLISLCAFLCIVDILIYFFIDENVDKWIEEVEE